MRIQVISCLGHNNARFSPCVPCTNAFRGQRGNKTTRCNCHATNYCIRMTQKKEKYKIKLKVKWEKQENLHTCGCSKATFAVRILLLALLLQLVLNRICKNRTACCICGRVSCDTPSAAHLCVDIMSPIRIGKRSFPSCRLL